MTTKYENSYYKFYKLITAFDQCLRELTIMTIELEKCSIQFRKLNIEVEKWLMAAGKTTSGSGKCLGKWLK